MKKILVLAICCLNNLVVNAQQIIYVDQSVSTGQQTGTSWTDALISLQDAISFAQHGDQIWIARGTYYPTTTADRSISFQLKSGVSLYGGFVGNETSLHDRNPSINLTRLSGNIGDTTMNTDNSIHVAVGEGLDEQSVIDGLVFSDGYSIGDFSLHTNPFGAGMYLLGSSNSSNSRPTISNCIFEANKAGMAGGGLYISFVEPENPVPIEQLVNPIIKNCTFKNNYAQLYGGALYKQGPAENPDTFTLKDCHFLSNEILFNYGAGAYFQDTRASSLEFKNCTFESNYTAFGSGGGLYIPTSTPGSYNASVIIEDCIFKKNVAGEGSGFTIDGRVFNEPDIRLAVLVKDCLFEQNTTKNDVGSAFLITHTKNGYMNATVSNCMFLKNSAKGFFTLAILAADDSKQDALIENCVFYDNFDMDTPTSFCAAIGAGGTKNIHTKINNCVFANNGNAIFAGGGEFGQVTTDITNCTFFRNGTQPFGKRWYPSFSQAGAMYYNRMNFKNCVIWEDQGNPSYMFYNNDPDNINGVGFRLDYCSLNPLNPAVIPNASIVVGDSIYIGDYPAFLDSALLDFRLDKCSFAINKGTNAAATEAGLVTDLDGLPRVRFDTVDLGAYEQQTPCIVNTATNPILVENLLIAPNPGSGNMLSFQLPGAAPASGNLRLYTSDGRVLVDRALNLTTTNTIPLPDIPSGTYHILLLHNKTAYIGKWVVLD